MFIFTSSFLNLMISRQSRSYGLDCMGVAKAADYLPRPFGHGTGCVPLGSSTPSPAATRSSGGFWHSGSPSGSPAPPPGLDLLISTLPHRSLLSHSYTRIHSSKPPACNPCARNPQPHTHVHPYTHKETITQAHITHAQHPTYKDSRPPKNC